MMGRVKTHFHDEICGVATAAEQIPLKQAVREHLARDIGKPRHVADILDGKWDDTPAFRKLYGQMWLLAHEPKENA